jgi:uncharacterized protein YkwD
MRAQPCFRRVRLGLEILEDRSVPTTATLAQDGVLTFIGTTGADNIQVTQSHGVISASGVSQTFAAASVGVIVIDGDEGNDTITVDASIHVPTWIYGGGGNDFIQGGGGANHIYGGAGDDTIIGGSSSDVIFGGSGANSISAPPGASVTAGDAYQSATLSSVGQQIIDLTNQFRAAYAQQHALTLVPLTCSGQLTAEAQIQVADMVAQVPYQGLNGAMAHTLYGVAQPTMTSRANVVGYDYWSLGENIAYGFADANSVFQAWINSSGHLANIVNSTYTQIGVALAYTSGGVPYWAQEFGKPVGGGNSGQPPNGFGGGSALAGQIYAVGSDAGSTPMVTIYDAASGAVKYYFAAYDMNFRGGVRVATGDVNGDGVPDFVVAPGPGMAPLVGVYDGLTGQVIRSFYAYSPAFTGGVFVAVGDVNGDGYADIITGADAGGGPHVEVFDGATGSLIRSFFAYAPTFRGGVRVAAGDVNGDGYADIITGAGPGGGPHVEVFDGATGSVLDSFYAYAPTFSGGVYVSAGDVNGDGLADIVTGAGAGGGPHVRAFSGNDLSLLADFFASTPTFTSGIHVRAMDLTGDGRADIVTATGPGSREVRIYRDNSMLASFLAGDPANIGGVFVG